MKYTRNSIYSYVKKAVELEMPNAFVTAEYTATPAKFPAVFIREISQVRTAEATTLAFTDKQHESSFEVQIFSAKQSGAMTEAYKLMEIVRNSFNELYFAEISETPIENAIDKTIFRLVARFRRVIGGGDTMPTKQ